MFDGIVLGMSHAYRGLDINLFHDTIFNFAVESNDLFDDYRLIQRLQRKNVGISDIKYCIFELPYYIFNWDRSLSHSGVRRMNSYAILEGEENQYHHLEMRNGNIVHQYHVFEDMFKRKKMYNASVYNTGIYDVKDVVTDRDFEEISHVWKADHTETWKENIIYFQKLIALLCQINEEMKIYVTVFPQNPRFYKKHIEIIERGRNKFYETIESMRLENVVIWDYFDLFEQREDYFEDDCHLNTSGRMAFTKKIIRNLETY